VDAAKLRAAVNAAFAEPDPSKPRRTRALIVVHGGRIVAERYAPGFDASMPLAGWSMAKMALNALIGIAAKDGRLALTDTGLLPEWGKDDPRRGISLEQLMHMTSGLAFNETYSDLDSDVMQMLFVKGDKARFAASKPLEHAPGSAFFSYASGTSLILARVLANTFASERDYLRFPRERLFAPLKMRSAVMEPDAAATFVASSFLYASARDFARLGLLYLRDGTWQGERLLPEGWVAWSLRPVESAPGREYGAHIWLRLPQSPNLGVPPMPADAYYMLGHDQQIVAMVPSRDLVIVRLGLTREGGAWDHARDLAPIVEAFAPQL
jgi:CubicO group peptidase (beta-lactamase class C family)